MKRNLLDRPRTRPSDARAVILYLVGAWAIACGLALWALWGRV